MIDPTRLYTALLNTGLQQKDNPLYQVIHDLIGQVIQQAKVSTTIISGGGSGVGPRGIQGLQGIPGSILDNYENDDSYPNGLLTLPWVNYDGLNVTIPFPIIIAGGATDYIDYMLNLIAWSSPGGHGSDAGIQLKAVPASSGSPLIDFIGDNGGKGRIGRNPNAGIGALFVGFGGTLANAFQFGTRDSTAIQFFINDVCKAIIGANGNIGIGPILIPPDLLSIQSADGSGAGITIYGVGAQIQFHNAANTIAYGSIYTDSSGATSLRITTSNSTIQLLLQVNGGPTGFGGITNPTAYVHLPPGTIVASHAPLKFSSGPLLTAAEAGAIEFLTDTLYCTITTGTVRKAIAFLDNPTFTTGLTLSVVGASILSIIGTGASGQAILQLSTPGVAGDHDWDIRTNGTLFLIRDETIGQYRFALDQSGRVGIGGTTGGITGPTANLHLGAGTATANTAPLKINSGTLLTSPEAGAIEFLTDKYYGTITTGTVRKQFAMVDSAAINTTGVMAKIDTAGLQANVGASTLFAVPAGGEGLYRVSAYVVETVAGSLTSVLPNVQIVYTDKDSNASITIDATPVLGVAGIGQTGALNANTVGTASSGVIVIYVKASITIQYQTVNYASNLAGMTYALHIRLELM
jgi:hypothetical protein